MTKKILIADDDPGILEAIEAMLNFIGYEVVTSTDGEALLDMKDNLPDLFLLDIWMPGTSGTEICRGLKRNPATRHIPVILISAGANVKKAATDAAADDYIAKPFDMYDLIGKIERLLNNAA